jgi:hypothetical protein
MMNNTLILILFTLTFSFARGQNTHVRRVIKIVYSFDYDSIQDGKLYLLKKGNAKTDTITTEYNRDGTLLRSNKKQYITIVKAITIDSTVLISSENNIIHNKEYWSDTTLIDIYTQKFKDSTIQIKTLKNDTIQINKSFFLKGQLVKTNNHDFRSSYRQFNEVVTYDKYTQNRIIATIVTTYYKDGFTDTIRIDNKRKLYKTLGFNSDKNEWYVNEKTKYHIRKKVFWKHTTTLFMKDISQRKQ